MFKTKLSVNKCLIANAVIVVQSNHRRLDDNTQAAFGIARVRVNAMNAATAIDKITHAKVKRPAKETQPKYIHQISIYQGEVL